MKRIHLFEFEDFSWFPNWLRISLTRLIIVVHKILGTEKELEKLLKPLLLNSELHQIVDLCSGSGGPMPAVVESLYYDNEDLRDIKLILTDLYPSLNLAKKYHTDKQTSFYTKSVDATKVSSSLKGIKTMICSFHHMTVDNAKKILKSAKDNNDTICIYEISDNSFPTILNLFSLPINIIMCLLITPFVRPLTLTQLVFTYLIPIIPIFYAWDGAVSNARTYTLADLDVLLEGLHSDKYKWEKGIIKNKGKAIYLIGKPV